MSEDNKKIQDNSAQNLEGLSDDEKAKLSWKEALRAHIMGQKDDNNLFLEQDLDTFLGDDMGNFGKGGTDFSQILEKNWDEQNKDGFVFYVTDFDINNIPQMDFSGVPSPLSAQEVQQVLEKGQVVEQSSSINSLSLDKIKQNMDTIRQNSDDSKNNEHKPKA